VEQTSATLAWAPLLDLDAQPPGPLHERLTRAIRGAIRDGRLTRGAVLPPSRTLAEDLAVSRWTVTRAYSQLVTEGYLASKTGSATRVLWAPAGDEDRNSPPGAPPRESPPRYDLNPGNPDYRAFPRRKWVDAIRAAAESAPFNQLSYASPGGEPRLRRLLADQLNRSRGADAEPGMVSVFMGATQGMAQVCHALYLAGYRQIGIENPGSPWLVRAAQTAGLDVLPIRADADGMVTDELDEYPGLRVVFLGASHQILYGNPLAVERRAALLAWARRADGLIIEDDYDAEFTLEGTALPVMQGSDRRRVILLGSMSRALTPTVSVGWAVAPPYWVDAIRTANEPVPGPPALTQLALANFIESGGYGRHMRASRQRLRARRDALLAALREHLPEYPVICPKASLQLLIKLPPGADVAAVVTAANRHDIGMYDPGFMYFAEPVNPESFLEVGYTNLNDHVIEEAAATLARVIRESA
jgi:GntR family transcriptional regulator / MocR family aminotransferase